MNQNQLISSYDLLPVLLTVKELMTVLRIGRSSAYNLVHSGQIQCIHVCGQIRVERDELLRFLHNSQAA